MAAGSDDGGVRVWGGWVSGQMVVGSGDFITVKTVGLKC